MPTCSSTDIEPILLKLLVYYCSTSTCQEAALEQSNYSIDPTGIIVGDFRSSGHYYQSSVSQGDNIMRMNSL